MYDIHTYVCMAFMPVCMYMALCVQYDMYVWTRCIYDLYVWSVCKVIKKYDLGSCCS